MCYLKIINTFFEINSCIWKSELSKELKDGIEILVDQVVFLVIDQNSQNNVFINNSRTIRMNVLSHPVVVTMSRME